jgi:lysophospholipase L1-like esterase
VRAGTGDPPVWDWDMEYVAQFGWRADQVRDNISGPMDSLMPDVVMLNIGINDLFVGQSTESTAAEISQIIDRLRSKNANVTVLLALLSPTDRVSNSTLVEMNSLIAGIAQTRSTSVSAIRTVDLYTGFDHTVHTYDGTHPNAAGEALQAQRWFDALKAVLPAPAGDPHAHH